MTGGAGHVRCVQRGAQTLPQGSAGASAALPEVRVVWGTVDPEAAAPVPVDAVLQRRDRCRQALADWMALGHSETQLRALAKATAWAVAPAPGV